MLFYVMENAIGDVSIPRGEWKCPKQGGEQQLSLELRQ